MLIAHETIEIIGIIAAEFAISRGENVALTVR
jgi:hypothetical protein